MTGGAAVVTDPGKRPGFLLLGVGFAAMAIAMLLVFPGAVRAQFAVDAGAPARFQLVADSSNIHNARIQGIRPDSVFFSDCADCRRPAFALNEIIRLDVRQRPPGSTTGRIAKGVGLGVLAGAVVGALVGSAIDRGHPCKNNDDFCIPNAVALPILGVPLGAIIGGWVGVANSKRVWINIIPGHG